MRATTLLVAFACMLPAAAAAEVPPPVPVSKKLSRAQQKTFDKLAADFDARKPQGRADPKLARVYLHLAARGPSTTVVLAGLEAMGRTWANSDKKGYERVDKDFTRVVLARMRDKTDSVAYQAFETATVLVSGDVSDETLALVADFAKSPRPAVRRRLYWLVGQMGTRTSTRSAVLDIIAAGLDDNHPANVAYVARLLWNSRGHPMAAVDDEKPWNDRLAKLRKRPEAAIVVYAVLVSNLRRRHMTNPDAFEKECIKLLKDKRPSVRAAAAMALGFAKSDKATSPLLALLDDKANTETELDGFKLLNQTNWSFDTTVVQGPYQVRHAAVQALMLIATTSKSRFYCEPPRSEADMEVCIAKARAWAKAP